MRCILHDFAGHPFQAQLSRQLAARGHKVLHVYPDGLPGPKGRLQKHATDPDGLQFAPIPLSPGFRKYSARRRFLAQRKYARDLKCFLSRQNPDVVLSGNTPIDVQTELLGYCRRNHIGFVHWVQDVYCQALQFFFQRRLGAFSKVVAAPFRLLEKRVAAKSQRTIVIASQFKKLLTAWGVPESKVTVIENWAPLDEVPQLPRENSWRQAKQLGPQPVLLYSGTLGMKHRPDLLYRLAEKLGQDCRVVVLTDGVGREFLEKQFPLDNLVILGFQPYDQVPHVLASADILIATLEADAGQFAVPSKILTYLCAGRPILLAGPKENLAASILQQSGGGVVVDPDDPEACVDAARELLANPQHRAQLGQKGRNYAERTFDIDRIAADFESVLTAALQPYSTDSQSVPVLPLRSEN